LVRAVVEQRLAVNLTVNAHAVFSGWTRVEVDAVAAVCSVKLNMLMQSEHVG
jgi:hypothetical protein